MGLSLQEQLLKAGIADKKQAKKARHEKRVKRKKNKGKKATPPEITQTRKDQLAQARRSQELNRQLNQEKEKLEKISQARQLITTHRLKLDDYEEPYYFKVGKKIKKLYVDENIAKQLKRGALAIVRFDDLFEIVPAKVAQQIADRDPDSLVVRH